MNTGGESLTLFAVFFKLLHKIITESKPSTDFENFGRSYSRSIHDFHLILRTRKKERFAIKCEVI